MSEAPAGEGSFCLSFPPCVRSDAEILILGSMPGAESLRCRQYYAFRRNVFWRIMGELFSFDPLLPYAERLEKLQENRIALWDVIGSCSRKGSLDSAIQSPCPNDLRSLMHNCPGIRRICCNGGASARYFRRFFPEFMPLMTALPSTSPAAAGIRYEEKLSRWRDALTL